MKLAKWETFLQSVERQLGQKISDDELDIVWEACDNNQTVEDALERIYDRAATEVIEHFSQRA